MSQVVDMTDGRRPVPILLLVRELGIGGCESDLTKLAVGIDRRRFEPHVGCLFPDGIRRPQLDAAGVPVLSLPVRSLVSRSWIAGARQLRRYIRDHRIQLVHTFDAPMDMVALPIAWACRVPVRIKSHLWYRGALPRKHQRYLSITDRMATAIVVNSRAVQRELTERYGVHERSTRLCYNGVDTQLYRAESDEPEANAPFTIGTICALRDEKRVDILVDAFARVRRSGIAARLLIVGSGPMRDRLEKQSEALGVAGDVHFQPTTGDVPRWLRKMDIFALTSETESFPNALLEAMATGRCVVASNVGGVPELVRDGVNGLLFDAGNAEQLADRIAQLTADSPRRLALAKQAEATARSEFALDRNLRCFEQIYDALLQPASRPELQ
jgi:L-malate glycosyltransferase